MSSAANAARTAFVLVNDIARERTAGRISRSFRPRFGSILLFLSTVEFNQKPINENFKVQFTFRAETQKRAEK
jgi:hypothetical protein